MPAVYARAKTSLRECAQIDECGDWANKAAALASYARQAKDHELPKSRQRGAAALTSNFGRKSCRS